MDKILFIVPPNITFQGFVNPLENQKTWSLRGKQFGVVITDIPLGPLSLSAYVKKVHPEVETKLLDFNVMLNKITDFDQNSFDTFFTEVLSGIGNAGFVPTIVAISSLFNTAYHSLLSLASISRRLFPGALVIAGGNVPTTMYRDIYSETAAFDGMCYGEGELQLADLLAARDRKAYMESDRSWITPKKLEDSAATFEHRYIEDLDEIPPLDFGMITIDDYRLSPTINAYTSIGDKRNYLTMMTSRGCPFKCTFCAAWTVHGRDMRYHSVSRVRSDLTDLVARYGIKTLVLEDDHFLADKARAVEILGVARDLGLNCFFPNALALYALDRNVLGALKEVGVRQLTLAVESGSQRVLRELMRKPLKVEITQRVANDCREMGIYTDCNIIIGMPGETAADVEEGRRFLRTLGANWYRINVATPLVGSEMYDIAKKKGYLAGDILTAGYKAGVIETEEFTSKQVDVLAYDLNLELNFVCNSDMRLGEYETALHGFENVIRARSDHAFAYYFAAECLKHLNQLEKGAAYMDKALEIFESDPFWRGKAKQFNLDLPELSGIYSSNGALAEANA